MRLIGLMVGIGAIALGAVNPLAAEAQTWQPMSPETSRIEFRVPEFDGAPPTTSQRREGVRISNNSPTDAELLEYRKDGYAAGVVYFFIDAPRWHFESETTTAQRIKFWKRFSKVDYTTGETGTLARPYGSGSYTRFSYSDAGKAVDCFTFENSSARHRVQIYFCQKPDQKLTLDDIERTVKAVGVRSLYAAEVPR